MSCEWNPAANRALSGDEQPHATATVSVGRRVSWHLCKSCALSPRFARMRVRVPIASYLAIHAMAAVAKVDVINAAVRVYIAASSADLTRAEQAIAAATAAGLVVAYDWTRDVRAAQAAGHQDDASVSPENALRCAQADINGVRSSDVFWLLSPAESSFGAGVELGVAIEALKCTVISGVRPKRIWETLVSHTVWGEGADALALAWIVDAFKVVRQ